MHNLSRRGVLLGLGAAVAAPSLVRAESLMKIRGAILPPTYMTVTWNGKKVRVLGVNAGAYYHRAVEAPVTKVFDVPWLGSIEKSMAEYTTEMARSRHMFDTMVDVTWTYGPKFAKGISDVVRFDSHPTPGMVRVSHVVSD